MVALAVGTGKRADASLILVKQLIATLLSTVNDASAAPICGVVAAAQQSLTGFAQSEALLLGETREPAGRAG
jgi:hypothetical protein